MPCLFMVGMRLEAIDPLHQSTFCVVSVAEVSAKAIFWCSLVQFCDLCHGVQSGINEVAHGMFFICRLSGPVCDSISMATRTCMISGFTMIRGAFSLAAFAKRLGEV